MRHALFFCAALEINARAREAYELHSPSATCFGDILDWLAPLDRANALHVRNFAELRDLVFCAKLRLGVLGPAVPDTLLVSYMSQAPLVSTSVAWADDVAGTVQPLSCC